MFVLQESIRLDVWSIVSIGILGFVILFTAVDLIHDIKSLFTSDKWISTVSINQLVQEIILYSNDILWGKGIEHFPSFKVSYHPHKKFLGAFDDKRITVYIRNIDDIQILILTVLHELRHYIQAQVEVKNYARYDRYAEIFGYVFNPLEIQCHLFALKWLNQCIDYLFSRNIIKKCE